MTSPDVTRGYTKHQGRRLLVQCIIKKEIEVFSSTPASTTARIPSIRVFMQAKRGSPSLWLYTLWWSIGSAAAVCGNNYVTNPSASSPQNVWNIYQPDTNLSGATISNRLFRIETTGYELLQRGYFSQEINILNGASNFTISAQMKRDVDSNQGSPSLRVDLLNKQGIAFNEEVSTDLVGTTLTWKEYAHSFYLPGEATKLRVKLWVEPRPQGATPSPNVAYFDDICVTYATLGATVQSVTTVVGKRASLTCVLSGIDQGTFSWTTSDEAPVDPHRSIASSSGAISTLNFVTPAVLDEGNYTCHTTTNAGNTSATGSFLVYTAPYFTATPNPIRVRIGDDLTLPCGVAGRPSPVVMWYKDGRLIREASYNYTSINPSTHDLTIHTVNVARDTGIYMCYAVNEVGNVRRIYNLTLDSSGSTEVVVPGEPTTINPIGPTTPVHNPNPNPSTSYPQTRSQGTHPSDGNTEEVSFWDKKFVGLYVYIWIAIGAVVVILLLVLIIACSVALCKRRSKRKKLIKHQQLASVRYNKGSRRGGYAVSDTARIVGPGNHMHSRPNSYYPDGTLDSGYNSKRPSMLMQGNAYLPGDDMNMQHVPLGERYQPGQGGRIGHHVPNQNQIHFPQDSNLLVPRIPTEDELQGHENPSFYEELPDVQRETADYLEMTTRVRPSSQKEQYVTMQSTAIPAVSQPTKQTTLDRKHQRQSSSLDESNLDSRQCLPTPDEPPPLPTRPSHMAPEDEKVKRLSVDNSQAEPDKRCSIEADVPDTPGDIDYRL